MKVAIGLFGIHYVDVHTHWMGWRMGVDYQKTLENNKILLYNDIYPTFYSSTYFSEKLIDLVSEYNFKLLRLQHLDDSIHSFVCRNRRFKETIELILSDTTSYDFVILTRYDIQFNKRIFDLPIDKTKINIFNNAWYGDYCGYDDNFYLIPYKQLNTFYSEILQMNDGCIAHFYKDYLSNVNLLVDGVYYIHNNPIYSLYRINT